MIKGTIYGTTASGGTDGDGTVFSIVRSGTETVLHNFAGKPKDGSGPVSSLVSVNGTLYGTTEHGGAHDLGTVFSIAPSGTEIVLHNFKGGATDGAGPQGPLVEVRGKLYGTTSGGGAKGSGTFFSITPSGTETVIYSFRGGHRDGGTPRDALINVRETLYGITTNGDLHNYGTIYSITPSGTEHVLHRFGGGPVGDGAFPEGVPSVRKRHALRHHVARRHTQMRHRFRASAVTTQRPRPARAVSHPA
jgi:uncharacterized repeat protein (TIGR03803 family)